MKLAAILLLELIVCRPLSGIPEDDPAVVAQNVGDAERQLPWFWSSFMEGLGDIPYTWEMQESKQPMDRSGNAARPGTSLKLERIPLAGGSYYRCLLQNGTSPCSAELVNALELDSQKAASFTADERAKATAAREDRRARRRAFWTDFPNAFHFQQAGPTQIRFTPTGKYRPQRDPNTELLARIKGDFWFDPRTFEITRLEYQMLADGDIVERLYKGTSFSVALTKIIDDHYLPVKVEVRRVLPKGGIETSTLEFAGYRRFSADSSVQFVDKDK